MRFDYKSGLKQSRQSRRERSKNEQNPNHRQRFSNEIVEYEAEQARLEEEAENEITEESGITAEEESADGQ